RLTNSRNSRPPKPKNGKRLSPTRRSSRSEFRPFCAAEGSRSQGVKLSRAPVLRCVCGRQYGSPGQRDPTVDVITECTSAIRSHREGYPPARQIGAAVHAGIPSADFAPRVATIGDAGARRRRVHLHRPAVGFLFRTDELSRVDAVAAEDLAEIA